VAVGSTVGVASSGVYVDVAVRPCFAVGVVVGACALPGVTAGWGGLGSADAAAAAAVPDAAPSDDWAVGDPGAEQATRPGKTSKMIQNLSEFFMVPFRWPKLPGSANLLHGLTSFPHGRQK
jgi:hypothetical protein